MADPLPGQTAPVPLTNYEQMSHRISSLQAALSAAAPGYEKLLQEIHTNLAQDEEMAHLLTEEQVGVICAALTKKKGIVLAEQSKKSGTTANGGKKLKDVTLDDL